MPTYVYRRDDGSTFEIKQRITDDPLETCPETGQSVSRVITGSTGLIFKGDGFYVNDYGRGSQNGSAASDGETASNGETASDDTSSSTTPETSEAA